MSCSAPKLRTEHTCLDPVVADPLHSIRLRCRPCWAGPRLERAIGVIYRPRTERQSHYFYASLPRQFDAVIHLDETEGGRAAAVDAAAGWGRDWCALPLLGCGAPYGLATNAASGCTSVPVLGSGCPCQAFPPSTMSCSADPAGGYWPLGDGLGGAKGRSGDLSNCDLRGHGTGPLPLPPGPPPHHHHTTALPLDNSAPAALQPAPGPLMLPADCSDLHMQP